jgi:hypothetical protein
MAWLTLYNNIKQLPVAIVLRMRRLSASLSHAASSLTPADAGVMV